MNREIKNAIIASGQNSQYDECAKRILGNKDIIANILIKTVDEFKNMSVSKVKQHIETIEISKIPIEPGLTNAVIEKNGDRIIGFNTENFEINEGKILFDIVCYVRIPEGHIQLILNIEAQKNAHPGYSILNRAIFYTGRLLSSQKEKDFKNKNFDDIKKVYSVWICMNTKINCMSNIHLTKNDLIGNYNWHGDLNLINIYLIGLSNTIPKLKKDKNYNEKYKLHRLLGSIFSNKTDIETKLKIITENGIELEDSIKKDVNNMCNLSEGIFEEGLIKGTTQGKIEGRAIEIIEMGKEFGLSKEQILEKLKQKLNLKTKEATDYINLYYK